MGEAETRRVGTAVEEEVGGSTPLLTHPGSDAEGVTGDVGKVATGTKKPSAAAASVAEMQWTLLRRSPPARRPSGLVSAYGSELHGFRRGNQAFFAEPLESWLAVLADSVPLHQRCFVVCPRHLSRQRVDALGVRAREHIPYVEVGQLGVATPSPTPHPPSSAVIKVQSSTTSPLESVPPASFDIVVFAGNVFATDMLFDVPWHVSAAHRALRPHGVLAIMGSDPILRVSAPDRAAEDVRDFYTHVLATLRHDVERIRTRRSGTGATVGVTVPAELASATDDFLYPGTPTVPEPQGGMKHKPLEPKKEVVGRDGEVDLQVHPPFHALEQATSAVDAHADVYLPFRAVQRRWFDSTYQLSPSQFIAAVRGGTLYQAFAGLESARDPPCSDRDEAVTAGPLNVRRATASVDALQALSGLFTANSIARLEMCVRHFVVSCSNRTMNQPTSTAEMLSRLQSPRPSRGAGELPLPRLPPKRKGKGL